MINLLSKKKILKASTQPKYKLNLMSVRNLIDTIISYSFYFTSKTHPLHNLVQRSDPNLSPKSLSKFSLLLLLNINNVNGFTK